MSQSRKSGSVLTFYSYKGGVGRSMGAANIAALLAQWGRRVLVLDFDLEAPGIERYFDNEHLGFDWSSKTGGNLGLVDLVTSVREGEILDWREAVIETRRVPGGEPISILSSGSRNESYIRNLQLINWEELFEDHDLEEVLYQWRREWKAEYDFVIIDSRTGINDIGGICTILLPDTLVMFFTANEQSIEGIADVMERAQEAQELLEDERERLTSVPVLSRDDRLTEKAQSEAWRARIALRLKPFYKQWLHKDVDVATALRKLYLPQVAYWSFGERLPVIENPVEAEDPGTLTAAYTRIAILLDNGVDWASLDDAEGATTISANRAEISNLREEIESLSTELHASQSYNLAEQGRSRLRLIGSIAASYAVLALVVTLLYAQFNSNSLLDQLAVDIGNQVPQAAGASQ